MEKIVIIGRVPPPVGGVSTVVYRQSEFLKEKNEVFLFSEFRLGHLFQIIQKILFSDKIYVHSISELVLLLLFFLFSLKKTIVVDHNHMRKYATRPNRKKIVLWLLSKVLCIQLDSQHLLEAYGPGFKGKTKIITPFYPPTKVELDKAELPTNVQTFISSKSNIIVVSAWRLIFENGIDLYGFDFSLDVLKELEKLKENIGMILCIGDVTYNKDYFDKLKNKVTSLKLDNNVLFWENCKNSWVLFREPMIYFRPTSTDGNSISILEAVHFGIPVIASDVIPRPKEVKVFSYSDIESAKKAILQEI
ncbi:MAG: hypothetical protein CSA42_01510 [Gammaproteobacteria bacterium]|nr:MAG: hypothetical protein CSA42_01510 [Gammaproteobacteria bacterium]